MRDIRELSLDDLGENYNANDLCAMAKHLMTGPVDMAYNQASRQLFVVMDDGTMAVLNQNAGLGISAWGRYTTAGKFMSVAVVDDETYVVVKRGDDISLEKFDASALSDGDNDFSFCAAGLPIRASGHNVSRLRIRKIMARVLNTKSLFINGSRVTLPATILSVSLFGNYGI